VLDFLLGVAILAAIFGIVSVSLNLQAGVSGLLNFGQIAFFGFGAYGVAIAEFKGGPVALGWIAGIAVAAVAGAAVGRMGRTLAADYWAIATLALAQLVQLVATNQASLTNGPAGIGNLPVFYGGLHGRARDLATLATLLAVLAASWVVSRRLIRAQFGRVLRLLREQPELAASLGHDVVRAKVRVLAFSGALAALAGALYTLYVAYMSPEGLVPDQTFLIWTMLVVGGLGSTTGAIVGAFLVQVIYDTTRFIHDVVPISAEHSGALRQLTIGLVLLGFLMLRPGGLVPERIVPRARR
jgi:branched-chain amino acid transport system permease protein